jgi:ribonucleoside-triphosphate reductase
MPRLAYQSKDKDDFYQRLTHLMDIAAKSLKIKRQVVSRLLDQGLYPYTKRYLGTFNNHFSTIGLVGMNECCLNAKWIREDLTHEAAQNFTVEVLNFMREKLSDYQELYGDLYNLEATPAESTSYRLAKHDKEAFPDIITATSDDNTPYYTNSSHLPVWFTEDVFKALDVQDKFQPLYTSGTVFHTFLGERMPSWQATAKLVRTIANNYKLPYFTLSPTYSICAEHGYLTGNVAVCPHCGKETEVYSRITGYYRPIKNWNAGKTQEFKERKEYEIEKSYQEFTARSEQPTQVETQTQKTDKILLFTSPTCPNCKMAKMMLDKAGVQYEVVDAMSNRDLTEAYKVVKAPTLIVPAKDDVVYYNNASEIKRYIEENK